MDPETSVALLERVRLGDREALDLLLRRYVPALRRWARGRLPRWARDLADTEDLVQETVIRTLRNLKTFEYRHEGALQAYLRQAVMNRIRDEIRRVGNRPEIGSLDEELADARTSPLEAAVGAEAVARYEGAAAAQTGRPRSDRSASRWATLRRDHRNDGQAPAPPHRRQPGPVARRRCCDMAPDAARLLALAEAIADGRPLDWADAESALETPADRALVRELRLLAGLADAHRSAGAVHDEPEPQRSGDTLTQWGVLEIRERIGSGTFGTVYRAWDPRLAREVALKILRGRETDADGRAVEEGRLLARVRHPQVITVFGADRIDGRIGIWMELVHGQTLEGLLRDRGPFSAREAASMGAELCAALAAVHRARLVHRDDKAQNVMREAGGRLMLMDFGAGEDLASAPHRNHAGTPVYMAPELFDGAKASPRSDIYSLGVLLFHIVTGEYPVTGATTAAVREAHVRRERRRLIDLRPDLPRAFVHAVDCALERDPGDRFETAGAMERALSRAFEPEAGTALPETAEVQAPRRPRPWLAALGGLAVMAVAAVAVTPTWRERV
jgi:serine/threonine-protein kinase